jgi:hypothetical protein
MSLLTKASLVLTPNAIKSNKVYSIIPSNGNGDFTFTRDTAATQINSLGNVENVLTTIPRLNYDSVGGCPSLLLEPQRMNRLLNSAVVVNQTIATTGLACTVSFYGTGTIVFSGTYVGTLVGTGVNNRVSLTFTPTTGSLVLTVTGSVTKGQLETGSYPTSYIPTTTSATTRNADSCSKSGITDLIGQTEGTMYFKANIQKYNESGFYLAISNGNTLTESIYIYQPTSGSLVVLVRKTGNADSFLTITNANWNAGINKIAIAYTSTTDEVYINGVSKGTSSYLSLPSLSKLTIGSRPDGVGTNVGTGTYDEVLLFKTRLTNTELQQLTTL